MTLTLAPNDSALLTVDEAARFLRLSRQKVYTMAARGEIPTVKMGRSVRLRRDRLEAWLDERSTR